MIFNRKMDYLRISVTDRCNLRCNYCMPSVGLNQVTREEILSFEEIIRAAKIFASLGVKKIRLTGGEPLIRKGIINLIEPLVKISGIEEVTLTTNGILLAEYAQALKSSGIKRVNISLDTLRDARFKQITGSNSLPSVISGIDAARSCFELVKLNVVVLRGVNDNEIVDFVNFALSKNVIVRFIEFMKITPLWREGLFYPIEAVKEVCLNNFSLCVPPPVGMDTYSSPPLAGVASYFSPPLEGGVSGPAEYYEISASSSVIASETKQSVVGFIKTAESNCCQCNRLRITSCGNLKLCLYEPETFSLRDILRSGASDAEIIDKLLDKLALKSKVSYRDWESEKVYLSTVGG